MFWHTDFEHYRWNHMPITFYINNRNIMSDILHAITTIILCNSLGEKNKIFSQQLINKNKWYLAIQGRTIFLLGLPIQKMELEKIVVKGTEYLSPNKFYGHTKHSSNAKYTCVFILWILYCRSDSLIIHKFINSDLFFPYTLISSGTYVP